jgi:hypothetical protein
MAARLSGGAILLEERVDVLGRPVQLCLVDLFADLRQRGESLRVARRIVGVEVRVGECFQKGTSSFITTSGSQRVAITLSRASEGRKGLEGIGFADGKVSMS